MKTDINISSFFVMMEVKKGMNRMRHYSSDTTNYNFDQLLDRLYTVNKEAKYSELKELWKDLAKDPTLIMATGGSKAAAVFLSMVLEEQNGISEVIEPRDFFHKKNLNAYHNLVALSAGGSSNGIKEALTRFEGESYLITGNPKLQMEKVHIFDWSNDSYQLMKENSFISMVPTINPMLLFLEWQSNELESIIHTKLQKGLLASKLEIEKFPFDFKNCSMLQVMTGYDTRTASQILESNLSEAVGLPTILHEKGEFCHGRSNLLYHQPQSPLLYLMHERNSLDDALLEILTQEYPHIFIMKTNEDPNPLWNEFQLSLHMYYLSKKIAEDRGVDLTCPDYNRKVVQKVYRYRGEM